MAILGTGRVRPGYLWRVWNGFNSCDRSLGQSTEKELAGRIALNSRITVNPRITV